MLNIIFYPVKPYLYIMKNLIKKILKEGEWDWVNEVESDYGYILEFDPPFGTKKRFRTNKYPYGELFNKLKELGVNKDTDGGPDVTSDIFLDNWSSSLISEIFVYKESEYEEDGEERTIPNGAIAIFDSKIPYVWIEKYTTFYRRSEVPVFDGYKALDIPRPNKEITENIILEGRLEDVKKKYPNVPNDVIDDFYRGDPSGNGKYLDWMTKIFYNDVNDVQQILLRVFYFHQNQQSFKQKDINQYKDLSDLIEAIEEVKQKKEEKKEKKNVDRIYEDDNYLVVSPKTHSASCTYGAGTKWCITTRDSDHHWNRETAGAIMYFVINKNLTKENPLYKLAIQYFHNKFIIWDAEDRQTPSAVVDVPNYIWEKIESHKEENLKKIDDARSEAIKGIVGEEVYVTGQYSFGLTIYESESGNYYIAGTEDEWLSIYEDYYSDLFYDEDQAVYYMDDYDYDYYTYVSDTDRRLLAGDEARWYADEADEEELISMYDHSDEIEEIDDEINELLNNDYGSSETTTKIKELESKKEGLIDSYRDSYYDDKYDEWYDGLKDPVSWYVDELGHYSTYKEAFKENSFIQLDIDALVNKWVDNSTPENMTGYSYEDIRINGVWYSVSEVDY